MVGFTCYFDKHIEEVNRGKEFFSAWNWASFFLTSYWLAYRRCYKWLILISVAYSIATGILSTIGTFIGIGSIMPFLTMILYYVFFGVYGNSIYFKAIKEKIYNLKMKNLSDEEILKKTQPSFVPPIILLVIGCALTLLIVFLFVGVFAAIFAGLAGGTY